MKQVREYGLSDAIRRYARRSSDKKSISRLCQLIKAVVDDCMPCHHYTNGIYPAGWPALYTVVLHSAGVAAEAAALVSD